MAPKRSSSTSGGSSGSKKKKAASFQQSTLSFSSGKISAAGKKSNKSSSFSSSAASKPSHSSKPVVELSLDDDEDEVKEEPAQIDLLDLLLPDEEEEEQEKPDIIKDLDIKGKEWTTGYIEAKRLMGKVEPIHADGESKIDTILRIFDLDFRYGPCTSISRLDRWNRAERLGLEPPSYVSPRGQLLEGEEEEEREWNSVKDILTTRQGREHVKLKDSVFYGTV